MGPIQRAFKQFTSGAKFTSKLYCCLRRLFGLMPFSTAKEVFIQSSLAIFYKRIFVLSKWPQILPTTRWPFRGFMSAVSRLSGSDLSQSVTLVNQRIFDHIENVLMAGFGIDLLEKRNLTEIKSQKEKRSKVKKKTESEVFLVARYREGETGKGRKREGEREGEKE